MHLQIAATLLSQENLLAEYKIVDRLGIIWIACVKPMTLYYIL